jgi:hypothetical protein
MDPSDEAMVKKAMSDCTHGGPSFGKCGHMSWFQSTLSFVQHMGFAQAEVRSRDGCVDQAIRALLSSHRAVLDDHRSAHMVSAMATDAWIDKQPEYTRVKKNDSFVFFFILLFVIIFYFAMLIF